MVKYTIDIIKQAFAKEGYVLLTNLYINKKQKLNYVCPKGHIGTITWNNWHYNNNRCNRCANNIPPSISEVRTLFEKEGYKLISNVYKNAHTKLKYICPNGHIHEISLNKWKAGQRCNICFGTIKKSIEDIRKSFISEGYILITEKYFNAHQKLEYICPKEHKHSISWGNWQQGKRCPYCTGHILPLFHDIKESFKNRGYILLSNKCSNSKYKLKYICPNGHKHSISWSDWRSGYGCPRCAGNLKLTIEQIRKSFEICGYKLLSDKYINSKIKLFYKCPFGHENSILWVNWIKGARCPICSYIKRSGPGHPNWRGGIACEPYCEIWVDKIYKNDIKIRDNYMCLNPVCNGLNKVLSIHHINYNKKNCHPSNLITLCRSCNGRANKDRIWHQSWYQTIMNKRYGYIY